MDDNRYIDEENGKRSIELVDDDSDIVEDDVLML